jgi:hypothetical protein
MTVAEIRREQTNATVIDRRYRKLISTIVISAHEFKMGWMLAGFSIARFFCLTGGALALVGLILWAVLPLRMTLPPYFFTPILAVGYGLWCWRRVRAESGRKEARE